MSAVQWIFPTSIYGGLSDVYGTAVTQYANNPGGFPLGSGLLLGQGGLLFDFSVTRLLNASGTVAQYAAVTYVIGNSNDYTVATTTTANTIPIIATNDRAGSTSLATNNTAWMTTKGIGTTNCAGSVTAPKMLCSSATAGQLQAVTAGTSVQFNIALLNTTTSAGAYPVSIL
jgi:hypothetical protein